MSAAVSSRKTFLLLFVLALSIASPTRARAATIMVGSLAQKTSGVGPCSLQEAIYSANFDASVAINGYDGSTPRMVTTQCEPGNGDDTIVLPTAAFLSFTRIIDDADNHAGPTATPIITSRITIAANGATLQRTGTVSFRLFTVANTGYLTIERAFIRGFRVRGGNGADGGGGGMGGGGAVFVTGGHLVVDATTFENNSAQGGVGAPGGWSGGGGGMGGNGGKSCGWIAESFALMGGSGGGGARGDGASCNASNGGGGGGTISSAISGFLLGGLSKGGFACGANGTDSDSGKDGRCAGGGGGGAGEAVLGFFGYDGGSGKYGGGGGGGVWAGGGAGGHGGFGGGGGSSGQAGFFGVSGGNGGFGGGGGMGQYAEFDDGDPGNGGFFGGNGSGSGGGGGAGLGGAIFNESGIVEIRNSTFSRNAATGGTAAKASFGLSGGAAIFAVNGSLTVLNSTLSGNQSNVGGGILVGQSDATTPTAITVANTIFANNGDWECAITGKGTIAGAFAGNLIMSNDGGVFFGREFIPCQGVVSTDDPQLGPLKYNLGATPTMAISASSPAHDAADPGSSLPIDQRKSRRPSGGYDIGAFELCDNPLPAIGIACGLLTRPIFDLPEFTGLTFLNVQAEPPEGGTTMPSAGILQVDVNSLVPLNALPNPGFRFATWSTNVANPLQPSTTITVTASQTATAYFEPCACATEVTPSIDVRLGGVMLNPITRRWVQTVTLTNNSADPIAGPLSLVLDNLTTGVTLANRSGTTTLMLPAGSSYLNVATTLAAGQSAALQLQFTNPGNGVFSYDPRVLAGAGSR